MKGISHIVAILLLMVVAVSVSILTYLYILNITSEISTYATEKLPSKVKIDGIDIAVDGTIILYVRTLDDYNVTLDMFYLVDPQNDMILTSYKYTVELRPGEVAKIYVPSIVIRRINLPERSFLILKTGSAEATANIGNIPMSVIKEALSREFKKIGYRAYRSSADLNINHFVVLDPVSGKYRFYENTVGEEYYGYAPIYTDTDEIFIPNWVPWDQRPFDSPVLVIVNPTYGHSDWVFTVNLNGVYYRFKLDAISDDVVSDYLFLWEDLYNPIIPPRSVDDWMDHVVRVSLFFNGTYRVAVYRAKGGYRQAFYVGITSLTSYLENPAPGCCVSSISAIGTINCGDSCVYCKDFGVYWANVIGGYYTEFYHTNVTP